MSIPLRARDRPKCCAARAIFHLRRLPRDGFRSRFAKHCHFDFTWECHLGFDAFHNRLRNLKGGRVVSILRVENHADLAAYFNLTRNSFDVFEAARRIGSYDCKSTEGVEVQWKAQ